MNNEKEICDFGLHSGESYRALPVTFLNWMVETDHLKSHIAKNELQRRSMAVQSANEVSKNS
ncbi:hypothetical protein J8L98_00605 [Pseudoalteromonas sp. MMG013]|uniref:hypothetical protein n=1 Tax=unclassified Pseudoalteromonas TaxID=194690 RepID=UPI001B386544|nr:MULTISPECIES: hypothetical protein [unclassified Pseudoalteromonas]MBQ4849637.1 hypothetical protein [Pseudoalteromonas sp. MMG012]MBQ4860188.1 hypothetical protein [Pseudoalteromonas sp. MMG013]